MAACTNNGGSIAKRAVTAALVGVLSVGTVPMAALAAGVDGIQTMATDKQVWDNTTFKFDHEANADGSYTVSEGDFISLVSGTDPSGNAVDLSDVTVGFFTSGSGSLTNGEVSGSSKTVAGANTLTGYAGEMPKAAGKYWLVVFDSANVKLEDGKQLNGYGVDSYKSYLVNVVKDTTSLEGAQAFQYDSTASDKGVSDTTFNYTGAALNVAFEVNGEILDSSDVNVVWTKGTSAGTLDTDGSGLNVTEAGTYTARLTAKDGSDFTGSVDVTFEVKGIALGTDSVSIAPKKVGEFAITNGVLNNNQITANGVSLVTEAKVTATLIAENDAPISADRLGDYDALSDNGKYTFKLTPANNTDSVTGEALVDVYVVNNTVEYKYNGGDALENGGSLGTDFDASKGTVFTTAALTATVNDETVPFTATVTKDGETVTSYDEPGTYTLTLDTPVSTDLAGNYDYAGHCEVTFTVKGKSYAGSTVYASYEGKNIEDNEEIDYTGKAVEPLVIVRDKDNKLLTEGTDYTVKLTDAEGNEVESATEVGDYKVVVTFNGDYGTDGTETVNFKITKATIVSAKATADFFGIPEEGAATPTFVGYTEADCKGQEFALDPSEISVRYYKYDATQEDNGYKGDAVKAEDLIEEGAYVAQINVLTSAKNVDGTGILATFTLSKNAVFTDVDANAWYAQVVAKAYSNYYVNGIANTNFFAPEAQITRADVACILYNMAGGNVDDKGNVVGSDDYKFSDTEGYVTGFDDVDGHAYYAQAIAWAHASGVVNGYDGNFRPADKVTREEFAAMLANFAKVKGDYAAPSAGALDGVSDASTVSDWAKESVAWAVENGIMGNGGYVAGQSSIIRAEVAAMAVNYQPENLINQTR